MGTLIFIFISIANANVVDRMNAISYDNFRDAAIKCGYKPRNFSLYAKKIVNKNMLAELTCIESKIPEVLSERLDNQSLRDLKRQAQQRMKNRDCSLVGNQYMQDICYILK